jgi:hypothetical protein
MQQGLYVLLHFSICMQNKFKTGDIIQSILPRSIWSDEYACEDLGYIIGELDTNGIALILAIDKKYDELLVLHDSKVGWIDSKLCKKIKVQK